MKTLLEQRTAQEKQNKKTIRTANGPRYKVRTFDLDEHGEPNPSLTDQAGKDAADIKNIIRRHDRGEIILNVQKGAAQYGDFTELNEFQENMNFIASAKESFAEIPSKIRKRFGNDPGEFYEFVTNPENQDEMVKLGLAVQNQAQRDALEAQQLAIRTAKAAAAALPADADTTTT